MFKRISLIVLALAMVLSISAFADDVNTDSETDPSQVVYLGKEDPDAILKDAVEPDPFGPKARARSLFSFTGEKVYNLLTTYNSNGKSFKASDLTNGYLGFGGTGKYSASQSTVSFKVGACYLESSTNIFQTYPDQFMYCKNNIYNKKNVSADSFSSSQTYYGFMSNLSGNSNTYLMGTFYYYNGEI